MKGVIEEFLEAIGLSGKVIYDPDAGISFLHPGRQASMKKGKLELGFIGQLHPEVVENYDMKGEVYVAVLDMPTLTMLASFDRKYEGIAKFPAITRDLSMVMDKTIFVGQVEALLKKCGGKLLEKVELFDVYEGAQVGEGKKSVAFSLAFRDKEKTLSDAEVNPIIEKIIKELGKLGIELRS